MEVSNKFLTGNEHLQAEAVIKGVKIKLLTFKN